MPNTTRQSPSPPSPHTSCPEDSAWPPPPQSQWRPPHSPASTATMPPDDDRDRISPSHSPSPAIDAPSPGTFIPITTTTNTTTTTTTITTATPAADDDPPSPSTSLSRTMSPAPQSAPSPSPSPSRETSSPSPAHVMGGEEAGRRGDAMDVDEPRACAQGGQPPHAKKSLRVPHDMAGPAESQASSSAAADKGLDFREDSAQEVKYAATSMGSHYPSLRAITTSPSSYLRAGTKFHGTQQSERQVYDVAVEIKHVDLRDSFLCGYLRIQDLTEDHPTLTTYFEGEIIGPKYGFITNHPTWGATDKVDLSHWAKFNAFRPYVRSAKKQMISGSGGGGVGMVRDVAQQENVFMRWKEHFLVPDHRVTTIRGASFEGFYYICFNQVKGEVSGIYFHSKSEKFQQLELKHVPDRGCFPCIEFR